MKAFHPRSELIFQAINIGLLLLHLTNPYPPSESYPQNETATRLHTGILNSCHEFTNEVRTLIDL